MNTLNRRKFIAGVLAAGTASAFPGLSFAVHYEYPLGEAEHGARKLTIDKSKVLAAMRRDLQFVKTKLRKSGLL
ncbi:MAG: twin-arginine translocation signal domain-containing protein [Calditrichaeota bacterium]|nr:twin-arginine translocation signal domain-containing protein [Calditrichota bacterium]